MINLARLNQLANAVRERTPPAEAQRRDAQGRSWYRIANAAGPAAEVYLYDMIGEWGITAQDFVNDLRGVRSQAIDLHLNCEGGEVFDGLAIYESLRQHPANVTAYIDGVAASAASFIAMAADRVVMAERARMMIHDAHGLVIGNAADMREMADLLDDLSNNVAEIYADRAGGTATQWRAAMHGPTSASDGTWYDARAAVAAGLADEVATRRRPEDRTAAKPAAVWNSAAFATAVREVADPEPPLAWEPGELIAMFREVAA